MKTITIQVTEIEHEALKLLAAEKFLRIDEDAISGAARHALLDLLDLEERVVRKDVISAILNPSVVRPTNGFVEAAKARQEVRVHKRTDLKIPQQIFNDKPSNTWLAWCWLVKVQLNQKAWSTFTISDVARGTGLSSTQSTSVSETLARSDWIVKTGKTTNDNDQPINLYTFTSKARSWLMDKKNQQELVELKVLDELDEWGDVEVGLPKIQIER